MTSWKIKKLVKKIPKLNNPILIEGLPGIGNVGKVAVDFIIEEVKAEKAYDLFSYSLPNSVFVNEENLVELPSITIYYKKFKGKNKKKRDLILLGGDIQPTEEKSSYEFCEDVLNLFKELGGKEVITLGGVGLPQIPEKPKVFLTGNNKKILKKYKEGNKAVDKLYGVVGPIIGVSGLLICLAGKKKMDAVSLLSETYGHPMYLGMKGAREIITILNKKLSLNIKINRLDKDIKEFESEIKKSKALLDVTKKKVAGNLNKTEVTNYIG